jgi:hypothetical protein
MTLTQFTLVNEKFFALCDRKEKYFQASTKSPKLAEIHSKTWDHGYHTSLTHVYKVEK